MRYVTIDNDVYPLYTPWFEHVAIWVRTIRRRLSCR